jgi:dihydrofolate reductase
MSTRPTVTLIVATSKDGFIARTAEETSIGWTSKEDKKRFVALTKRARVMVMGRTTFETIGRALPERLTVVYTSRHLSVPEIETTMLPPQELIKDLGNRGFTEIAICGGAKIYQTFLEAGLVDQIALTVEPVTFGAGIPLWPSIAELSSTFTLTREEVLPSGTIFRDYTHHNTP